MSKNRYWVLQLQGKKGGEIFESWPECKEKASGASRAVCHGFPTEAEALEFRDGKWSGKPISERARTWLKEYKAGEGQLKQDTGSDTSALSAVESPRYCAYVDGSYDPENKTYGFGVVFVCDGKIETFYGGGKDKELADMGCGAGELLACMEAVRHAEARNWPELTIIYDSELIPWAYRRCGDEMLVQAAGQYLHDVGEKIKIVVQSIEGLSHSSKQGPGIALADRLARKGAGITD